MKIRVVRKYLENCPLTYQRGGVTLKNHHRNEIKWKKFTVTQGNYCEMIAANFAMLSAILMSVKRVNG